MSNCDQYLPDLCAWMDGELEDSQALEAHLAQCASCRALVAQYRQLDVAIARVDPPAELHAHIMQGVTASHSPKAKRRFAFGSATAVAAIAAALVLSIGMGWISIPRWQNSASTNEAAADSAAPAAPAAAPTIDRANTTSSPSVDFSMEEEESISYVSADSAPVEEPAAGDPAESDAPMDGVSIGSADVPAADVDDVPVVESDTTASISAGTNSIPRSESSETEPFMTTVSSGDLQLESADTKESGLVVTDLESAKLLFAAAEAPLVWQIYGVAPNDLPDEMKEVTYLQVGNHDLWVASLDIEMLSELFFLYFEQLGGELIYGDSNSIVLNLQ